MYEYLFILNQRIEADDNIPPEIRETGYAGVLYIQEMLNNTEDDSEEGYYWERLIKERNDLSIKHERLVAALSEPTRDALCGMDLLELQLKYMAEYLKVLNGRIASDPNIPQEERDKAAAATTGIISEITGPSSLEKYGKKTEVEISMIQTINGMEYRLSGCRVPVSNEFMVSEESIDDVLGDLGVKTEFVYGKPFTTVTTKFKGSEFILKDSTTSVVADNYEQSVGYNIIAKRFKDKAYEYLGVILALSRVGG